MLVPRLLVKRENWRSRIGSGGDFREQELGLDCECCDWMLYIRVARSSTPHVLDRTRMSCKLAGLCPVRLCMSAAALCCRSRCHTASRTSCFHHSSLLILIVSQLLGWTVPRSHCLCECTVCPERVTDVLSLRLSPHSLFIPDPDDPPPPSPISAGPEASDDPIPSLSSVHNYPGPYPSASLGSNLAVLLELSNATPSGVMGVKMMCEVQSPGGRYRLGEVVHGQEYQSSRGQEDGASAVDPGVSEEAKKNEIDGSAKESAGEAGPSTPPPVAPPAPLIEPELPPGDSVKLDVSSEMKELGLHVLICSVAWETPDGRRTFQRFLKFNVSLGFDSQECS